MDTNKTIIILVVIIMAGLIIETALILHPITTGNLSNGHSVINSTLTTTTKTTTIATTSTTTQSTSVYSTSLPTTVLPTTVIQESSHSYPINSTEVDAYLGGTWYLSDASNVTSSYVIPGKKEVILENFTSSTGNKEMSFLFLTQISNQNATALYNSFSSFLEQNQSQFSGYEFHSGSLPNTLSYFIVNGTLLNTTGGSTLNNLVFIYGIFNDHLVMAGISNLSSSPQSLGYYDNRLIAGLSAFENNYVQVNTAPNYQNYITDSLLSQYFEGLWSETSNESAQTPAGPSAGYMSGRYFNFTNSTYASTVLTYNFNTVSNASNMYNYMASTLLSNRSVIYQAAVGGFSYLMFNGKANQLNGGVTGVMVIGNNIIGIHVYQLNSTTTNTEELDSRVSNFFNSLT